MIVTVNEKNLELADASNLEQLLIALGKPLKGSALAVNQQIISRGKWLNYRLNDGDQIVLFQAIAGG